MEDERLKRGNMIFASSKPIRLNDSKCDGLKRRLLNVPPSALKNKHNDHIVDAVCMGLALSEGKKVVVIKKVK